jgi:hypothetical protein
MKTKMLFVVAGLLASVPLSLQAKVERVVEKTFTVAPGGKLNVQTQGGNVRVMPGTGDQVKVVATQRFKTDSESEADEMAQNLSLTIEQSGNDVSAISKYDGSRKWFGFGGNQVTVNFDVTVPARYSANLRTSGGNIEIGDLAGNVEGHTSGGNVRVARVDGDVSVRTSGGNIDVAEALKRLEARTSGGHIRVARVVGEADVDTSGGNINVEDAAGRLSASTSGGNVTVGFSQAIAADCTLRTSGGNVTARVPTSAAFKLDARTSGGSVRLSDVTIHITEGAIGKSKVVGDVNGGGPLLKLSTSGGNVTLASK